MKIDGKGQYQKMLSANECGKIYDFLNAYLMLCLIDSITPDGEAVELLDEDISFSDKKNIMLKLCFKMQRQHA